MDNPFKKLTRPQLGLAIGGAALIGGFMVYRHHKSTGSWNPWSSSAAASAAGSASGAIDPVTGLPVSQDTAIDPVTNLGYLAEAQQYGSVAAAEAAVSAYGQTVASGSGIGVSPASPGGASSPNTVVGGSVYTSNSAWAQAATAGLADVGYSETDVATALGDYLTGTPLTAAQAQLVNVAIGEYGPAPTGNLQVILAPASPPSTTTSGSSPTTPGSPGRSPAPAKKPAEPGGVTVSAVTADGFTLHWPAVPGATSYPVRVTYQDAAVFTSTARANSATVTGLKAKQTYTAHVAAANSSGTSSETNGPTVKTT